MKVTQSTKNIYLDSIKSVGGRMGKYAVDHISLKNVPKNLMKISPLLIGALALSTMPAINADGIEEGEKLNGFVCFAWCMSTCLGSTGGAFAPACVAACTTFCSTNPV